MYKRLFSPYEVNQLKKFGLSPESFNNSLSPVEYLTGHIEFHQLDFLVNDSVLIPRVESDQMIDLSFDHIKKSNYKNISVADIGTGSGALGLSLAKNLINDKYDFSVTLSDISTESLKVAKANTLRLFSDQQDRFSFINSDLTSNFSKDKRFDIILANLPYIPSNRIPSLDSSVIDFEPLTALDGGLTGAEVINRLLSQIPSFLNPKGLAILEIDETHTPKDFNFPPKMIWKIHKDCYGKTRFLSINS